MRRLTGTAVVIGLLLHLYNNHLDNKEANETVRTHHSYSDKRETHFRTYGTVGYAKAKHRIIREAIDTGWFTSIEALGPENLTETFRSNFRQILDLPRGGGYWIWKYDVIEQALQKMNEGDFLVYLDAGSQINRGGEERFREYLKMLEESQFDMMCFQIRHPEYSWTTDRIFRTFNISIEDPIAQSGQIEGGTLLFQKGPHLQSWLKVINDVLLQDPWLITDKYNDESKAINKDFQDNRHDQSLSSVSRKKLGCEVLNAYEENYGAKPHKPFHVIRSRDD